MKPDEPSEAYKLAIHDLMVRRDMTQDEATDYFRSMGAGPRDALIGHAKAELLAKRRAAAGNPVYRPKWPHLSHVINRGARA